MNRSDARGFSLIELMIGITLGLFVLGGVIAMFLTSSATASNQQRLAQVLENGRYGMQMMSEELRLAGGQYCSSYAALLPGRSVVNQLRAPRIHDLGRPTEGVRRWGVPLHFSPSAPDGVPAFLDPARFVRGHDCDNSGTCAPALPTAADDINIVPDVGTSVGQRVRGTDVLTIRYLRSDGVSIVNRQLNLNEKISLPMPEALALGLGREDLAMIADCASAEIFKVQNGGGASIETGISLASTYYRSKDARVFNFTRDFHSVTYYVGLRADNLNPGQLVSSLFRIVDGADPEELIEGVERFDVTYAVLDSGNQIDYLTASQVATQPPTVEGCPPVVPADRPPPEVVPGDCLWRGVQGLDVSVLVASTRSGPRGDEVFFYSPDGAAPQSYAVNATLPSGIPAGNRLRREFRIYAALRNLSR